MAKHYPSDVTTSTHHLVLVVLFGLYIASCVTINIIWDVTVVIYICALFLGIFGGMFVLYRHFGVMPIENETKSAKKQRWSRDYDWHFLIMVICMVTFYIIVITLLFHIDPNLWTLFCALSAGRIAIFSILVIIYVFLHGGLLWFLWQRGRYIGVRVFTTSTSKKSATTPMLSMELRATGSTMELVQQYEQYPNLQQPVNQSV